MIDAAVLQGGAAALAGLAVGVGGVMFSEKQIERGEERDSDVVSQETRAKMSAMFMEDEVMPDSSLDDTVRRMEAALAASKGEDAEAAAAPPAEEAAPKRVSDIDAGW